MRMPYILVMTVSMLSQFKVYLKPYHIITVYLEFDSAANPMLTLSPLRGFLG